MQDAEGSGAQAAIAAARRARQDKHPSFRRLLRALAMEAGSNARLASKMGLPASRLSEYLNDRQHGKQLNSAVS